MRESQAKGFDKLSAWYPLFDLNDHTTRFLAIVRLDTSQWDRVCGPKSKKCENGEEPEIEKHRETASLTERGNDLGLFIPLH